MGENDRKHKKLSGGFVPSATVSHELKFKILSNCYRNKAGGQIQGACMQKVLKKCGGFQPYPLTRHIEIYIMGFRIIHR